jgi:hypothetical protein
MSILPHEIPSSLFFLFLLFEVADFLVNLQFVFNLHIAAEFSLNISIYLLLREIFAESFDIFWRIKVIVRKFVLDFQSIFRYCQIFLALNDRKGILIKYSSMIWFLTNYILLSMPLKQIHFRASLSFYNCSFTFKPNIESLIQILNIDNIILYLLFVLKSIDWNLLGNAFPAKWTVFAIYGVCDSMQRVLFGGFTHNLVFITISQETIEWGTEWRVKLKGVVLSFLAEGQIRKLPCLFFLFFFLKVVKQDSKEQVQKDHHSNDHERNEEEDGTVAIGSCEDNHVHVPTFPC